MWEHDKPLDWIMLVWSACCEAPSAQSTWKFHVANLNGSSEYKVMQAHLRTLYMWPWYFNKYIPFISLIIAHTLENGSLLHLNIEDWRSGSVHAVLMSCFIPCWSEANILSITETIIWRLQHYLLLKINKPHELEIWDKTLSSSSLVRSSSSALSFSALTSSPF